MTFRRILEFAWPFRARLGFCVLLMLLQTGVLLMVPWLGGLLATSVLSQTQMTVGTISIWLLVLFALRAALQVVQGVVLSATSEQVLAQLRTRLYDHVQTLPIRFFHSRRQGDLLALLTYEIERLSGFITGTLLSVLPLLLTVVGALLLMIRIDALLAIPVALCVPAFFVVMKVCGRRLRPLAGEVREAYASSVAIAEENLSMLPAIKSFTREGLESARHARQIETVRGLSTQMARIQAFLGPIMQFIAAAAIVGLLWIASDRVIAGDLGPGELITFLLYTALLTQPVAGLADLWGQLQMARGTLERLEDVLREPPEPFAGGGDPGPVHGAISFQGVGFSHTDRAPALHDVHLDIKAGETIALTGENGAGKSTLVDLLLRLHTPDRGRILLDGVDIETLNLKAFRQQIGVVPQNVLLFDGTVRDNILYGNPEATADDLDSAASRAQAADFIRGLPDEYDTLIGDKGVRLSGGQRQRIALARALLKDPAILILDEPTAMFDPKGEQGFVAEARDALANRTVILITHRPASLVLANRIVTLKEGRVVPGEEIRADSTGWEN